MVHLNYKNPYIAPFEEFQRFKQHPSIRATFEGGKRLSYGARAITEGGWQSVPKLTFPGGALIGCAAGFINLPRIKGSHNAILSGMLAAEHVAAALGEGRIGEELSGYEEAWRGSEIGRDLKKVRNVKPFWSKLGTTLGFAFAGFDMWTNTLGFSLFGTLKHGKPDSATLEPAAKFKPIAYPKPDGVVSFDKLSSVFLSNTNHEEDQPVHLIVKDMALQKQSEHDVYAGPRRAIVRPACTSGWKSRPVRASRSTRRTASTARRATSRTRTRTSSGCRPKAAAGRTIRICDAIIASPSPAAQSGNRRLARRDRRCHEEQARRRSSMSKPARSRRLLTSSFVTRCPRPACR